ncbi:MAG TPA: fused MFS/spermidine synthase [Syntrophorhabdaceae bacterium]|nr:fused MFS/spermidine synthase [Syntrophorhabdaceae bacterium]
MRAKYKTIALTAAVLSVLIFPMLSKAEKVIHTERSLYRNITVFESDGERCMRFTKQSGARQTCYSLRTPDQLVFNYTKMMLAALYLQPQARRILIIGLGGGTLPTTLSRILPSATIDVVEIDPAVVKVAKKYFNFVVSPVISVTEEDGRVFVKRAMAKGRMYDLILLDAFDHEYIPEHLLTQEFLREVKQIMENQGVLAANTWSSSRLYDHESATYESVFGPFYNLKLNSRIILWKKGGLPPISNIAKNAKSLEKEFKTFGVSSTFLLPLFSTRRDWKTDARVLTDQFSPSNLLNVR